MSPIKIMFAAGVDPDEGLRQAAISEFMEGPWGEVDEIPAFDPWLFEYLDETYTMHGSNGVLVIDFD